MAAIPLLLFFVLLNPLLLYASKDDEFFFNKCPRFSCGNFGEIWFPFTNKTRSEFCGHFVVEGCNKKVDQKIQLERGGKWYELQRISQADTISITDKEFQGLLKSNSCDSFNNLSLPSSPYAFFRIISNLTFFKCDPIVPAYLEFIHTSCKNFNIHYTKNTSVFSLPPKCSIVELPVNTKASFDDVFRLLTASFSLEVFLHRCHECKRQGKKRQHLRGKIKCIDSTAGNKILGLKLGLGLGGPSMILIVSISTCFIWRYRRKRKNVLSDFNSANASLDPYSKSDPEGGNVYFGVPMFSYSELQEATDNFDSQKELGEGGFGTVYHGKLQDGREVAVKRLYEHNCKRVKQFMNEIEILTCLRHKNLVSLYGCTSRRSRELLLVYEYIPNGTVADHLYHDQVKSSPLTWPIRMRIAIETASALTYLHASDIIHRDVKTNNILLDNNFCVKVADFGLSRLFPSDVTHISTAPQGTPGYLDPEYHQCFQLTDKSDVYSFGVVLIELISSMPAIDITRHKHEINLATLAINKIQKCLFDELIDPYLGYNSDEEIKRMTISVAELAFLCLQHDKEIRPCMIEVLHELKIIESGGYELEKLEEENGDHDASKKHVAALLKNIQSPPSSNSTTAKLISSGSTTPNVSSS